MIGLFLATALITHNPGFEDRQAIHGTCDTIELVHEYDARGVYHGSDLEGWLAYGQISCWSHVCDYPPWFGPEWPTMTHNGLVEFKGRRYRARALVVRHGKARWFDEFQQPFEHSEDYMGGDEIVPGR